MRVLARLLDRFEELLCLCWSELRQLAQQAGVIVAYDCPARPFGLFGKGMRAGSRPIHLGMEASARSAVVTSDRQIPKMGRGLGPETQRLPRLARFSSILAPLLCLLLAPTARAQGALAKEPISTGVLLVPTEQGVARHLATSTEMTTRVFGVVARTEVVQRFNAPKAAMTSGTYVFPLPEGAAVDRMRLQIGERLIEGEIHEKADAKRIFDDAQREGRTASLLEQSRPNLFSTTIANMREGEELLVRIEYQEPLRYDAGRFVLRLPIAITPRYSPGEPIPATVATDAPPAVGDVVSSTVSLWVDLDAGFEIDGLKSASHEIIVRGDAEHRTIRLAHPGTSPDRDFTLEWSPRLGKEPKGAFLYEAKDDVYYGLVMILPPAPEAAAQQRMSRETIFIIDSSGSMAGASMEQAKAALEVGISGLKSGDTFEVLDFDDTVRPLFGAPRLVDERTRAKATRFIRGLKSDGGTEMSDALLRAMSTPEDKERVSQIVFVTDGAVGNELSLYQLITSHLGARRLYTVGIGAAPNSWFMREAASMGRGTYTFIGNVREVEEEMARLFLKIEAPVLSDLSIAIDDEDNDPNIEMFPSRLPDLFAGEPLYIAVKLPRLPARVVLRGQRSGSTLSFALTPRGTGSTLAGVAKLWARAKIASLEQHLSRGTPEEEVRPEVLRVALVHGLVSKYTSFVAVDRSGPTCENCVEDTRSRQDEAHAGSLPKTGTESNLMLILGGALALLSIFVHTKKRASPSFREAEAPPRAEMKETR